MENNQVKSVKELLEEYKAEKGVKLCPKATKEEQETLISFDPITQEWSIYTTVPTTISKIVRENLITEIMEVYYTTKTGKTISSLEGKLLKAPTLFSTTPRKKGAE
ncbi:MULTISPECIES: hypothetical protein [Bacteria]|uniref:hypothetical protein n=1 Tax=Bacteria TaxID=2 RepID=UPI0021BF2F40|nr:MULTISPECIES: hypothetical protein [Bacteria]MDT2665539.1 hypothetical protein [Enterococcus hirae]WCG54421.1 hypothetical protein PML70_13925 [Enterococcus faecium]HDI5785764.1 hypothetical protein [Enterococcus faecium]